MPTPYEEISNNRTRREALIADSNLANDSNQLGGLDADEYATKDYVNKKDTDNSTRDQAYTDGKIEELEEKLKGYTDTAVGNQDFSDFAKKTDLETVQEQMELNCEESCQTTLTKATEHCEAHCNDTLEKANKYTDTVVGNQDFSDFAKKTDLDTAKAELKLDCETSCQTTLNKAKEYTDGKYDELFQSVSDGKKQIAEAITDKGVETSATDSYSQMASNIRDINTAELDTSDATATQDTILRGYTAYARGEKLTGAYVPISSNNPTYGDDTSDATATAGDIRLGKTAYARGQKLIGTLVVREVTEGSGSSGEVEHVTDLEEVNGLTSGIYRVNTVKNFVPYEIEKIDTDDEGNELSREIKNYSIGMRVAYASDTAEEGCLVREATENVEIRKVGKSSVYNTFKYIYSNPIADGNILNQVRDTSTSNEQDTKKWRYTYTELGLDVSDTIQQMFFNCNASILGIVVKKKDNNILLKLYEYNPKSAVILQRRSTINITGIINYEGVCPAKVSPYMLAYPTSQGIRLLKIHYSSIETEGFYYTYEDVNLGGAGKNIKFAVSDTMIVSLNQAIFLEQMIGESNYYEVVNKTKISNMGHDDRAAIYFSDDGLYAIILGGLGSGADTLYRAKIDYTLYQITLEQIANNIIYTWRQEKGYPVTGQGFGTASPSEIIFSKDNKYVFFLHYGSDNLGGLNYHYYEVQLDCEQGKVINGTSMCGLSEPTSAMQYRQMAVSTGCNNVFVFSNNNMYNATNLKTTTIVAVKYKGQMFYSSRGLSNT